jgi:integrase/recombinase XerD
MTWSGGCDGGLASFSARTGTVSKATRMLRDGVPVETVSAIRGHASISTTLTTYGHLTSEDARRVLEAADWFTGR